MDLKQRSCARASEYAPGWPCFNFRPSLPPVREHTVTSESQEGKDLSHRFRVGLALGCAGAVSLIIASSTVVLLAQRAIAPQAVSGERTPRARDGRSDLSGTWSFVSATPL